MINIKLTESETDVLQRRLEGETYFDAIDRLNLQSVMIKMRMINAGNKQESGSEKLIEELNQRIVELEGELEDLNEISNL